MKITIAVGPSRTAKLWENRTADWEVLLRRLAKTTVTEETAEEYRQLSKEEQGRVKDVGGFVGGPLTDGVRRKGHVKFRGIVTLDLDECGVAGEGSVEALLDQLEETFPYEWAAYSTHRHVPEAPRLRLVVPLQLPVTEWAYEGVARYLAKEAGVLSMCDETTFDAVRLMYWPSTPRDVPFVFRHHSGPFFLAEADRVEPVSEKQLRKKKDPRTLSGIMGAFCRAYSMEEAVETFLTEVYRRNRRGLAGRYDYIPADSAAGLVVYDGVFAYSFHGTDPAWGKLYNAYELVRLHRFGAAGEAAMREFIEQDVRVRGALEPGDTVCQDNWRQRLELDGHGRVAATVENLDLILTCDTALEGLCKNTFKQSAWRRAALPWQKEPGEWTEGDGANLRLYLEQSFHLYSPAKTLDAFRTVTEKRPYHPIQEMLLHLPAWDHTPRLDTLLCDYLGAKDDAYSRACIRKTLVAAVARVMTPGVKFDCILVLVGPQGIGKSTLYQRLAGEWFSDSLTLTDMRDKTAAEKLQGYWMVELSELAGFSKIDEETVKGFASRRDDIFRPAYGATTKSHPRQCVIVGSTNKETGFLRDVTGNRKFWPVFVSGDVDRRPWTLKKEVIDQIWAEALVRWKEREYLDLEGEAARLADQVQRQALEEDAREGLVLNYLERPLPKNWPHLGLRARLDFLSNPLAQGTERRTLVSPMEIWCECLGLEGRGLGKQQSHEINGILERIGGWRRYRKNATGKVRQPIYGVQRVFERADAE